MHILQETVFDAFIFLYVKSRICNKISVIFSSPHPLPLCPCDSLISVYLCRYVYFPTPIFSIQFCFQFSFILRSLFYLPFFPHPLSVASMFLTLFLFLSLIFLDSNISFVALQGFFLIVNLNQLAAFSLCLFCLFSLSRIVSLFILIPFCFSCYFSKFFISIVLIWLIYSF